MDVLIFGTGSCMEKLRSVLKDDINIIAFVDNFKNGFIEDIRIIKPSEIIKFSFDYIILASSFNNEVYRQVINNGVDKNKVLDFFAVMQKKGLMNSLSIKYKINKFLSFNHADGIVTGLSYFKYGVNCKMLRGEFYNFAWDSQDLYYDYKISKYLIDNSKFKLKYVFIGLSLYSFEYDLSKRNEAFTLMYGYSKIFNDWHNRKINLILQNEIDDYEKILSIVQETKIEDILSNYKRAFLHPIINITKK